MSGQSPSSGRHALAGACFWGLKNKHFWLHGCVCIFAYSYMYGFFLHNNLLISSLLPFLRFHVHCKGQLRRTWSNSSPCQRRIWDPSVTFGSFCYGFQKISGTLVLEPQRKTSTLLFVPHVWTDGIELGPTKRWWLPEPFYSIRIFLKPNSIQCLGSKKYFWISLSHDQHLKNLLGFYQSGWRIVCLKH